MTLFLKRMEQLSNLISLKIGILSIVSICAVVIIILLENNYGWIGALPAKMPKSIGKNFGNIGLIFAEIAIAYYLLRQAYVQIKKRKITIPPNVDIVLKSLLNITRLIHPFVGMLVICFVLLHGYIMTFVWFTSKGFLAIWSGGVALVSLVALGVVGWSIRLRQPALLLRNYHRYIAFLFFGLYFLHQAFAD